MEKDTSIMPERKLTIYDLIFFGIALIISIIPVIMIMSIFPCNPNLDGHQPPAGYGQTLLFGGSWAEQMIRNDTSFQHQGNPSTLKMIDVGEPWDTSMPFTYYFTFNDTNNTIHNAVVYIGQDAGSWKNGPFYDGLMNDTF